MNLEFEQLKAGYKALWSRMNVRPERIEQVDAIARRLLTNKQRYLGGRDGQVRLLAQWRQTHPRAIFLHADDVFANLLDHLCI
jgi:hypothetical protein